MGEWLWKEWRGLRRKKNRKGKKEGIMTGKMNFGEEWWRLVKVYVNKNLEKEN